MPIAALVVLNNHRFVDAGVLFTQQIFPDCTFQVVPHPVIVGISFPFFAHGQNFVMQLRWHYKALTLALFKGIELFFDPVHRKFREQGGRQRLAGRIAHQQIIVADIDGHLPQIPRKSLCTPDHQRVLRVGKEFFCINTSTLHADFRGIGANIFFDSLCPRHMDSFLSFRRS